MLTIAGLALIVAAGFTPTDAQTYTVLHDFDASAGDPSGFTDVPLVQGRDGNFYGESAEGGTAGLGTVMKITPSGTVAIILSFGGANGSNATYAGMTLGADGELYGNTLSGGSSNMGIIFKVTPGGAASTLHAFTNKGDGENPTNAPVLGTDGNLYGSANSNPERIYKVTPSGVFTTLHTLSAAEGYQGGQLSQGDDGNIYGGNNLGGPNGFGTLFKMTTTGVFTVLHKFTSYTAAAPGMVQAANGVYYGSGSFGGANNAGVIFKVTSQGTYTLLHSLNGGGDGSIPGVLLLATDGNFYGVAVNGGSSGCGTVFKITPGGTFTVVPDFDNTHGCNPAFYLTEGTDGLLYGVTGGGGAYGNGVFYSIDVGLAPHVSLVSMTGKVGSTIGILGQGFNGTIAVSFNGAAAAFNVVSNTFMTATVPSGATSGFVTVTTPGGTLKSNKKFRVMPQILSFSPTSGPVGTTVVITGGSFTGTNAVVFECNQTPASFTVNSDTQITAIVPPGATGGKIGVRTPGGTILSALGFNVTP